MPNWKKLIVSGSDANLNSLDITTELTASDALITNDLDVLGNITASGNISASGTVEASLLKIDNYFVERIVGSELLHGFDNTLTSFRYGKSLDGSHLLMGNVTASNNIVAAGNISASGDLYTNNSLFVGNKGAIGTDGNDLTLIANTAEWTGIQIGRFSTNTQNIELYGPVTASGNISASGDFIGTNFTGSSFTGSFVGDGSGLTGLNSGSWDGIFSGSAQITGSLGVTGSLEVIGNIKASGSIQVGVNEGSPTAALVGSIRYKSDANNSFVDMVMQTDVTTYEWVNIVTNTW